MPFSRKNRIALAVLCALPLLAGADDGLSLKPQSRLLPIPDTSEEVPLFVDAERIQGTQDKELEAFGNVRLRKRGQAFAADWMRHDVLNNVLDLGEVLRGLNVRAEIVRTPAAFGGRNAIIERPRVRVRGQGKGEVELPSIAALRDGE